MKRLIYLICLLPLGAVAAPSGGGEYDIIPRTVNFVIFAVILYYLLVNPVRHFYKSRILKISSRLDEIQKKLLESKSKKLDMMKKLEEAKANAAEALIVSKKEAEILANGIREELQEELALLDRHFEEQKEYELRKMEKEVISQVLAELFDENSACFGQKEIVNIMMKKAS
ncbi:F0F1 ATP synthase subunit B [Campylobacter vulpis]|uniref:F0F1 ATP synthase subunit B n=1 Tax=Campylobacter vulpis TaxID=1655500 RepID=UPI001BCC1D00|nr:F0F1 ATP synthase subunit B [Campylobacter vulpis]MBS4269424.1 F0F1 ATP synthase subunit B [Campylobacter vulpis]